MFYGLIYQHVQVYRNFFQMYFSPVQLSLQQDSFHVFIHPFILVTDHRIKLQYLGSIVQHLLFFNGWRGQWNRCQRGLKLVCHVIDKIILDHGQFLLPHDNHDSDNKHTHQTDNTKTRSDKHPSHIIIEKRISRIKHHTQVSIFRGLVIGEQLHVIESFCSLFLDILYDLLPGHNLPRERVINSRVDHFLFQVRIQINILQAFLHLRHLRIFLPQITNYKLPYQIHHSLAL